MIYISPRLKWIPIDSNVTSNRYVSSIYKYVDENEFPAYRKHRIPKNSLLLCERHFIFSVIAEPPSYTSVRAVIDKLSTPVTEWIFLLDNLGEIYLSNNRIMDISSFDQLRDIPNGIHYVSKISSNDIFFEALNSKRYLILEIIRADVFNKNSDTWIEITEAGTGPTYRGFLNINGSITNLKKIF